MATSRPSRYLALPVIFAVIVSSTAVQSTTLTVRQDGTGQFTTINAAKAVAVSGDVIDVGPGVYAEEVDFSIRITLVSTDGAGVTVLDGEHFRRILIFRAGTNSVVDGFTLRNGYHVSSGAALRVQLGATATVRNCIFTGNHVDFDGGAVICRDPGSRLDMVDCVFRTNTADRFAGAVLIVEAGQGSFDHCVFEDNSGPANGAIATNTNATYSIANSLFVGNDGAAAAVYATNSFPTITNNTFYANPGNSSLEISFSDATLHHNVIVGDGPGAGVYAYGNTAFVHGCNLYWNNNPDLSGENLASDETHADPLFCDALNGDFTISENSPAAAAHNPCGLLGAFPVACDTGPPPPSVAPFILSITDVPNDQGRQVRIRWDKAAYDAANQPFVITGYAVYRHQGAFLSLPSPAARAGKNGTQIDGWDYLATVPARGDDIYQYVAPTLCDKPKDVDPCWSVFFISALTPNPLTYFDSDPDSGYSEDNLPPEPPTSLAVTITPSGASLLWEPSPDTDVDHYLVYRSAAAVPFPLPAVPSFSTSGTEWTDPNGTSQWHYVVSAVDIAGNEGPTTGPTTTTTDSRPARFALRQNSPNPFNPSTRIEFDVPDGGGRVTIDVFDVAGRRVRSLLNEHRASGTWSVHWDGTTDGGSHASSGVYFCRLRAPGFERTLRMTLVE